MKEGPGLRQARCKGREGQKGSRKARGTREVCIVRSARAARGTFDTFIVPRRTVVEPPLFVLVPLCPPSRAIVLRVPSFMKGEGSEAHCRGHICRAIAGRLSRRLRKLAREKKAA